MLEYVGRFVAGLRPRQDHATVITLSGELGAGKTTFAQGIARALGVEKTVTSPTFVIEKVYELTTSGAETSFPASAYRSGQENNFPSRAPYCWTHLIHIDAYRLKEMHELEVLGWHEMVQEPSNLILIEWPEMVAGLIPSDAIRITLSGSGETREINFP